MEKEKDLRMIIKIMERIRRKEANKQKRFVEVAKSEKKNNQRANKYCNSPNAHSYNHYSKVFFIVL